MIACFKWQLPLVHLNDIVILSKSPGKHLDYVKRELILIHCEEVTLKAEKCSFFTYTFDYHGHVVRPSLL